MDTTTKHQQLNSLVEQVGDDAKSIANHAGLKLWFSEDDLKNMTDAASAILNKIAKYRELSK